MLGVFEILFFIEWSAIIGISILLRRKVVGKRSKLTYLSVLTILSAHNGGDEGVIKMFWFAIGQIPIRIFYSNQGENFEYGVRKG